MSVFLRVLPSGSELKGCRTGCLVISHDQHFLAAAANEYWAVTPQAIKSFNVFENAKSFALKSRMDQLESLEEEEQKLEDNKKNYDMRKKDKQQKGKDKKKKAGK